MIKKPFFGLNNRIDLCALIYNFSLILVILSDICLDYKLRSICVKVHLSTGSFDTEFTAVDFLVMGVEYCDDITVS